MSKLKEKIYLHIRIRSPKVYSHNLYVLPVFFCKGQGYWQTCWTDESCGNVMKDCIYSGCVFILLQIVDWPGIENMYSSK